MKMRVPGISHVESKITEEGRVLLKFQDGAFEDPFLARYVSDGTIKMLALLTLPNDPDPHPLLCVENRKINYIQSFSWNWLKNSALMPSEEDRLSFLHILRIS